MPKSDHQVEVNEKATEGSKWVKTDSECKPSPYVLICLFQTKVQTKLICFFLIADIVLEI